DDLDAAYAEIRRAPYTFQWQGREWTVCHFAELDYETQGKLEGSTDMGLDDLQGLFREAMGDAQYAEWGRGRRPVDLLPILFERWVKHSGSKQGEDSASSGSSGSTGKSSRRTSGGSTGSGSRASSSAKKATPAKKAAPKKAGAARPIPRKTAAVKA